MGTFLDYVGSDQELIILQHNLIGNTIYPYIFQCWGL